MKLLSPEEATAAFVTMNERFQTGMKAIENNKVSFEALFKEFTLMKQRFDGLLADHSDLKNSSSLAINEVESKHSGLYSSLSSSVLTVSNVVESFTKSSGTINQEIKVLKDGFNKLVENHNNLSKTGSFSIAEAKADIEDVKSTVINFMQKWEEKEISNKGVHADLKNLVNILSTDLIATKGTLREFVGATSGFSKDLASHKQSTALQFEQANQTLTIHVEDKLAALPKPSLSHSISPDDAKALIQKQTEASSLDAKNANLRSSNNEQKITMLEKKVENLILLLNKLQLSQ